MNEDSPKKTVESSDIEESEPTVVKAKESAGTTAFTAFTDSLKLFGTPHMLLLSLCAMYTGFEYSFLSGVYSTGKVYLNTKCTVGFAKNRFQKRKRFRF
jgi:hypothetical protein